MSADLFAAAVKLDDAARFRLIAGYAVARDSAVTRGHAALAAYYNETSIMLSEVQRAADADREQLADDFTRVIGVEAVGEVECDDDRRVE